MNKRCIVNVATGDFYCKLQGRLMHSLEKVCDFTIRKYEDKPFNKYSNEPKFSGDNEKLRINTGIDLILFRDCLPEGSRHHSESPYGFKIYAIKAAYDMGYTSILWLDSPCVAVKEDISPIFEKMEKHGYYAMSHIDPLENWVGDKTLSHYDLKREQLIGYNLPSGSCYGFDLSSPIGKAIFENLVSEEDFGSFKQETIAEGKWHRNDEAILALEISYNYQLPIFTFDPLFQSDSEECVIKSGGWL